MFPSLYAPLITHRPGPLPDPAGRAYAGPYLRIRNLRQRKVVQ